MLNVERLAKHYDTARGPIHVVRDASLTVKRGEAAVIMGPSGCGKSTLLYMLGALEPPTSGRMTLDAQDPYALAETAQARFRGRHIGFVFQDHLLLPQLSAIENVLAPSIAAPAEARKDPAELERRAIALLSEVGLADRASHRPGELSGGERQRVAVARALIRAPSLLLCDEPTGNLDRTAADGVAALLIRLHQAQKTMLVVVTHSFALAERFARRYELDNGVLRPTA